MEKGIRNISSFVDDVIALVVSSELEGETMSDDKGEGDGVKMMVEGRKVVWMAAAESVVGRETKKGREGIGELLICVVDFTTGGVVSSDGVVCREAVVSTVKDDAMSNTLGSSGSPLPLPVIPALGGGGRKGTCNTLNHSNISTLRAI